MKIKPFTVCYTRFIADFPPPSMLLAFSMEFNMKRIIAVAGVLLTAALWSNDASASPGLTAASVNMRVGPGTGHPVIIAIPPSQPLTIVGCLPGSGWCDVQWGNYRGWISASYVIYAAPGYSVPVTTVYHRVPAARPWAEARRDARVEYRVHRRWDRWLGD